MLSLFSRTDENNWLVPTIFLIPRVLNHIAAFGGRGTLVVPSWPSSAFWPMIYTDEGLSGIFSDFIEIPTGTDVFELGNYKNALFGSPNFRSRVLFLRLTVSVLIFSPSPLTVAPIWCMVGHSDACFGRYPTATHHWDHLVPRVVIVSFSSFFSWDPLGPLPDHVMYFLDHLT